MAAVASSRPFLTLDTFQANRRNSSFTEHIFSPTRPLADDAQLQHILTEQAHQQRHHPKAMSISTAAPIPRRTFARRGSRTTKAMSIAVPPTASVNLPYHLATDKPLPAAPINFSRKPQLPVRRKSSVTDAAIAQAFEPYSRRRNAIRPPLTESDSPYPSPISPIFPASISAHQQQQQQLPQRRRSSAVPRRHAIRPPLADAESPYPSPVEPLRLRATGTVALKPRPTSTTHALAHAWRLSSASSSDAMDLDSSDDDNAAADTRRSTVFYAPAGPASFGDDDAAIRDAAAAVLQRYSFAYDAPAQTAAFRQHRREASAPPAVPLQPVTTALPVPGSPLVSPTTTSFPAAAVKGRKDAGLGRRASVAGGKWRRRLRALSVSSP